MLHEQNNDFSQGSVSGNILSLALPMIFAQLVSVLYSVVDRMYIGHIPHAAANALTGVGLTFPIITIVMAFANLFGTGGAPLFSIARGAKEDQRAEDVMGNTFALLLSCGVLLTVLILVFRRPLLYLFGASDATFPYANDYISVYLCGSVFVMLSLGMNNFINAQGFSRKGMVTVLLGALINILLAPLFIFVLGLGVRGAAIATVISQAASALWAVCFLRGKRALLRLKVSSMRLQLPLVREICFLGVSGFIMSVTNSAVQIVCNATLQSFGGDLYVGVMTIINSIREIATTAVNGLTSAAQPVLGFNFGARQYRRVRAGIKFESLLCVGYTTAAWGVLLLFPRLFIRLFTEDQALIEACVPSMHIYFFGFFMMSLQMAGQCVAVALGRSRQAIFFSLLRKAVIVIPLTLVLPRVMGLGVNGVFLAEPISNFIGGAACYITMLLTIWPELRRREQLEAKQDGGC